VATHPKIAEVAIVGIPDAKWGEIVTAVVVMRAGAAPLDVDALRAFCAHRLAAYKHPRRVVVADALPRTAATGQIQRTLLVEQLQSRF
jgi:acyl-CoA synthetase (AMP-forming)/AMP-acid ligase II